MSLSAFIIEYKKRITELENINRITALHVAELEAESAARMARIEKLVRLCHEHGVTINEVLDTGRK